MKRVIYSKLCESIYQYCNFVSGRIGCEWSTFILLLLLSIASTLSCLLILSGTLEHKKGRMDIEQCVNLITGSNNVFKTVFNFRRVQKPEATEARFGARFLLWIARIFFRR